MHNDLLLYGECESKFGEDQARFSNGSCSVATWLVPEVCFCKYDSLKLSWEWKFRRVTKAGPCLAGREGSKSKECTPFQYFFCLLHVRQLPIYDALNHQAFTFYLSLICLTTRWCSFELLATTTSFVGALLLLAYFISISMVLNECIKTRSSLLNCALRDDEAVYWAIIGLYEAVAVGNWWYWVSRGHLCLYIYWRKWRSGQVLPMLYWLTHSLTDFER